MFVIPPFSCSNRISYSEGPPVYLERFLGAVVGSVEVSLVLDIPLILACAYSQSLQLPLKCIVLV